MKRTILAIVAFLVISTSCQPVALIPQIKIVADNKVFSANRSVDTLAGVLIANGVPFSANDLILVDGQVLSPEATLPENASAIQIRHEIPLTLINSGQKETIQSNAFTVGQALIDQGITLHEGDYLDPPSSTPILGPLTIEYRPAEMITITSGSDFITSMASAKTVGQALTEAGIPLQGLDYSIPDEAEPLPKNGNIKVVRVDESLSLVQKSIPFTTEIQLTADLELDQQDLLQTGEPGLAITRTRTRYEDGQEVNQTSDEEALVRPTKNRIIGAGTKIVLRTLDTPEGPLEYYRAVKVYATSYSPCRLGVARCGYGTAGGLKAQKGVIGVIRKWWNYMNGAPVYIPDYGRAVISDIGAGFPDKNWIDLAYSDNDYVPWHSWTTLYFLTPVPSSIMYVLP
jgi:resuscitation-promoting factor RpfB